MEKGDYRMYKRIILKILVFGLVTALFTLNCTDKNSGAMDELFVRLEITVKTYNSIQQDYVKVPGVVVEILTLSRSYINGTEFKKTTSNIGVAQFETYTNFLSPNKTYLIILSHPTDPVLKDTEHEFTMPQRPNLGNEYFIERDYIIERGS